MKNEDYFASIGKIFRNQSSINMSPVYPRGKLRRQPNALSQTIRIDQPVSDHKFNCNSAIQISRQDNRPAIYLQAD
jgi:hypothetical protein